MNNVQIVPVTGSKALINKFAGSEDKGYILLKQTKIEFGRGWADPKVRTALYKGTTEVLEAIIQSSDKLRLPGQIVVKEYVRSEVPEDLAREFFNQKATTEEELTKGYVKVTGGDNPLPVTLGGEEIIRFAYYDHSGQEKDVTVQHDNGNEISAIRKEQASIAASFKGAGETE